MDVRYRTRREGRRIIGFTLIELMIVVSIIGILAAIAYPGYQEHVRKTRRAEAKAALQLAAQLQERFYTTNNRYSNDLASAGIPAHSGDGATPSHAMSIENGPTNDFATSYLVVATPAAPFSDPKCGSLTYSSRGEKGIRGGTQTVEECWR